MWRAKRRWWVGLCAAVSLLLAAVDVAPAAEPSAADRESAKELFRAGRAAYERGSFRAAAASFEEAARLAPHPQAWYAAGDAWDAARDAPRAVYAFEQALALSGLAPPKIERIRRRLQRLTRGLGVVRIEGPHEAAIAVAHVRRASLPVSIHVPPGEHEVRLIEPATAAKTKLVQVVAGQSTTVTFTLPAPEPVSDTALEPEPVPPGPDDGGGVSGLGIAGWTILGIGLGGSVAAGVVTAVGLDARDEWEADRQDEELLDRAESLRTWTGVAWVAAGTVVVTGASLLVVDAASTSEAAADDEADVGLAVRVRFGPLGGQIVGCW